MKPFENHIKSWSQKQLVVLFVVALLVFTVGRWDMQSWVQSRLDTAILQSGLNIDYEDLRLRGLSLQLRGVNVALADMPHPMALDMAQIALTWSSLWHGAVQLQAENTWLQATTNISLNDGAIDVQDLEVQCDVAQAQAWYGAAMSLPFSVLGQLHVAGNMAIDKTTGIAQTADLKATLISASVAMMQQHYALGDYALVWQLHEQVGDRLLSGGEQVVVEGKGVVNVTSSMPMQWPLTGAVDMTAGAESPLVSLLPQSGQHITLAGTLGAPRWTVR